MYSGKNITSSGASYLRSNVQAFTLLEVLVGVALFAIVAVSLYQTFHTLWNLSERTSAANAIARELRWVIDRIGHDLDNLVDYKDVAGSLEQASFQGETNRMSFFVHTPVGIKQVVYFLETPRPDADRVYLCRKTVSLKELHRPGASPENDIEVLTDLLENKSSLSFQFANNNGGSWESSWSATDLPSGVSLGITLTDGVFAASFQRKFIIMLRRHALNHGRGV